MLKDVWNVNATECDKVQDAGGTNCDLVHQISKSISCLMRHSAQNCLEKCVKCCINSIEKCVECDDIY